MNYSKEDDGSDFSQYFVTDLETYGLNYPITLEEILQCINNLKRNKAAGSDGIVNEYIYTSCCFFPIYVKLFNLVFDSGVMPGVWIAGITKPIYKNKGDKKNPDNYRDITLFSCLGKLFTAVLNKRLNYYADRITLLTEAQTGFRKGYNTSDNIFVLSSLIEHILSKGKKCSVLLLILRKHLVLYGERDYDKRKLKVAFVGNVFELYIICILWRNQLYLLTIENPSTLYVILE